MMSDIVLEELQKEVETLECRILHLENFLYDLWLAYDRTTNDYKTSKVFEGKLRDMGIISGSEWPA